MPSATDQAPTVLVIDDEAEVRKLASAMMSRLGFRVLTADSGEHAITLFQQHQPLDLLLTDVVAPGLSGPQIADRLTELRPDLKVLYMSGYDNTHVVQHYVVEKGHALLHKPFTPDELARKVMGLLNRPAVHAAD